MRDEDSQSKSRVLASHLARVPESAPLPPTGSSGLRGDGRQVWTMLILFAQIASSLNKAVLKTPFLSLFRGSYEWQAVVTQAGMYTVYFLNSPVVLEAQGELNNILLLENPGLYRCF